MNVRVTWTQVGMTWTQAGKQFTCRITEARKNNCTDVCYWSRRAMAASRLDQLFKTKVEVLWSNIFSCHTFSRFIDLHTKLQILNTINCLVQGFPTFFLPCTPSAFRQMSMYPYGISTDKDVPLQKFDRWTCTPKTIHDKIFSHDFSQIHLTVYI